MTTHKVIIITTNMRRDLGICDFLGTYFITHPQPYLPTYNSLHPLHPHASLHIYLDPFSPPSYAHYFLILNASPFPHIIFPLPTHSLYDKTSSNAPLHHQTLSTHSFPYALNTYPPLPILSPPQILFPLYLYLDFTIITYLPPTPTQPSTFQPLCYKPSSSPPFL